MRRRTEEQENASRWRPSGRLVAGAALAALLLVWMLTNRDDFEVSFLVASATVPLWLALAIAGVLGFGAGFLLGRRHHRQRV